MTCTIRQIDPTTGTSSSHSADTFADALLMVAQIFDKHFIITDDATGETLIEILPLDTVPASDLHRAIANMVSD